jgi:hypothetical protein
MVAWLGRGHLAANRLDNTGWFMAEDRRRAGRQSAMHAVEITVAHAAGDGAYQHLSGARFVDFDILYREGLIGLTKNRGFD